MSTNHLPLFDTAEPVATTVAAPSQTRSAPRPPANQQPFTLADRWVKLRDAEARIAKEFTPDSRPSRNTLIGWIEDGTLVGRQFGRGRNYFVTESSLKSCIDEIKSAMSMELAA